MGQRRIPTFSVSGQTDQATEQLRLLFYLEELERQAVVFGRSFAEAMRAAARNDPDEVWRHVQSALFAGIVVHRLLANEQPRADKGWTLKKAQNAAKWRTRHLRQLVGLPDSDQTDTPLYLVAKVRNSLEHIDERIDRAVHSPGVAGLSDWYLSSGTFLMSPEQVDGGTPGTCVGLRSFHPESGQLFFDRDRLDLFLLDIDMLKLRVNIREARQELKPKGRNRFGGGQVMRISPEYAQARFEAWVNVRAEVVGDLDGDAPTMPTRLQDD